MKSILYIKDYSIYCHLGCLPEEQTNTQEVRVSFEVMFSKPVNACLSDRLEDTICYADLCRVFDLVANSKPFHTVEHLAWQIHEHVKTILPGDNPWSLNVHKVQPPIDNLRGGVHFHLGNRL